MGPNSGGNPSKNPAGKSNPASKWDDLKLSALALLGHIDLGSVPPKHGEGFRNDPQRECTHEERIAIWNDHKVAAPILLGKLSFDDALRDLRRARSNAQLSAANALESGVPFNEHATLWDDLQVGAKILLGLIDYEDAKRDFLRRQAAAMRGTAEAQEGEYDPAKHPRGGDARYPGRYSAGWGSGAASDPTSNEARFQGAVQICFRAGTPVSNEHGAEAIEKVLAGQYVHCVPEDNPYSEVVLRKVLATHRNDAQPLLRVRAGALDLWTTFNHPFWVEGRGWTAAGKLQAGDLPRTREGKTLAVREIAETGIVEPVYNLTVEDCHTYFVGSPDGAGAVLVHNQSPAAAAIQQPLAEGKQDSATIWKGAQITAKAIGLPSYLLDWNARNNTAIYLQTTKGTRYVSQTIYLADQTGLTRLSRIGNSGNFVVGSDISTLGELSNEAFHAWFEQEYKPNLSANPWLWRLMEQQRQFGVGKDMVAELGEEAMSELVDHFISELETTKKGQVPKIPTYDEIRRMRPTSDWYHMSTPGHNEVDPTNPKNNGSYAKYPGSHNLMSEELYYATIWVIYNGAKDPAPTGGLLAKFTATKRFFAAKFRPNWTPRQRQDFLDI